MHTLNSRKEPRSGFTIVELLIVIVVIGILAAIIIVTFSGVQKRAIQITLTSDLRGAANALEFTKVETETYPTTLPTSIKSSPGVTLSLVGGASTGGAYYPTLTPTQNAVLFQDTCLQTVAAGWGLKADQPSNSFITDCIVQERTQLRINGWNAGKYVVTPVTEASLAGHVSSYTGGNVALWQDKATIFMSKWKELFQAQGGSFPISGFWDPWATPVNGGIMKPSLPTPTTPPSGGSTDASTYCLQATHAKYADLTMHVRASGVPQSGACS